MEGVILTSDDCSGKKDYQGVIENSRCNKNKGGTQRARERRKEYIDN